MNKNILITSISAKVPMINKIIESKNKFDKNILVYGVDIDNKALGQYFLDKFWTIQKLSILDIDLFIKECVLNNIGYLIPSRDEDVIYFSLHRDKLEKNGIKLFSANYENILICSDKLKFYTDTHNDLIIPSYKDISNIQSKSFVVKERYGSGSKNIAINVTRTEAISFAKKLKNPIFQPFFNGSEYSIDSYVDKNGKCISSIARSRDLIKNGESQITSYIEDEKMLSIVKELVEELSLNYHSVTQIIKQNNRYKIIECNCRFGGASTLSYQMGLESFYWFLIEETDQTINFQLNSKHLKQVRFAKDTYFEC